MAPPLVGNTCKLLIPHPPCGNTSPCGATSPPVRTGKEQTAVAEIEVRRMWEGGPLRQWTAKRPSSGKWVPYEHGGFAGRYVCADCQQTVAGLYRQNAGAKWLCEACKRKLSERATTRHTVILRHP